MDDPEVKALLTEIRDAQREHIEAYQRIAGEALQLQRQAMEKQAAAIEQQTVAVKNQLAHARFYRKVVAVGAVIVLGLLFWLFRLLGHS